MSTPKETELYFQARQRLATREAGNIAFMKEAMEGFRLGTTAGVGTGLEEIRVVSETNESFAFISGVLAHIEAMKGKSYLASWQKRGMIGAFANLERKYDRANAIINDGIEGGESLIEQLADLSVYSNKMITLQAELNPKEFNDWLYRARNL